MRERNRVFVYITYQNSLLVFRHAHHPDAGIQVPGGTIEPHESPKAACLREATEETGLKLFSSPTLLGRTSQDMSDFGRQEHIHGWYYHLESSEYAAGRWQHSELDPSSGDEDEVLFELYWHPLPDPIKLSGIDDRFLPELKDALAIVA